MYNTQVALTAHLTTSNLGKKVKPYAGEVKDAAKLRNLLPAILVMGVLGRPTAEEPEFKFDLLIATETKAFDKKTNLEDNLKFSTQVAQWLELNKLWSGVSPDTATYYLDPEEMEMELLLQDNRFTIVVIHLTINRNQ